MAPVPPRVAVVGGGPCGSVAATMLRAMGLRVKLFDKGERLGGRASSRLTEHGSATVALNFDHGAQFLRASHPALKRLLHSPLAKDLFVQWTGRFGILGPRGGLLPIEAVRTSLGGGGLIRDRRPRAKSAEDGPAVYGMDTEDDDHEGADAIQALAELDFCSFLERNEQLLVSAPGAQPWQQLCERTHVDVAASTAVLDASLTPTGWLVKSQSSSAHGESSSEIEEPFDHLVLATQSSSGLASKVLSSLLSEPHYVSSEMESFLPALTELLSKMQAHQNEPIFSLLAAYPSATGVPFDAAVPHGCDTLRWICRDSSKPGI